jgi:ABC-type nitrate/sulfonate/bicarbonate transport system substrate-binding protein
MSRRTACAAALGLALIALPRPAGAAEAIVLQLHGPVQFAFAGYYAALWQGYYRDAGLAVEIRPTGSHGQPPADPVREVTEGRAQFGTGTMQLVVRSAQGLPLLLVAPIFQQSGAAVYYRGDADFSTPGALLKAKLGHLPASDILQIELETALRAEGIDPAKTKAVAVESPQIVAALADRTIDAAIGSAWIVPWQAHERGIILKSFNPANYRVDYYGDSLFTLQRFEAAEPATVARFRAASLKGWEYALQHPDEIAARLVADYPGDGPVADAAGFARYQSDVAKRLSRYPDVALGSSNLDRWTQIEAGMLGAGVLARSTDLARFVYNPLAAPASGAGNGRLGVMIGLALAGLAALAGILLGFLFWLPRRPRPAQLAASEPAASAEAPVLAAPPPLALPNSPPPLPRIDLNTVIGPLERRVRQRVRGKVRCRFSLLPELWRCRTDPGTVATVVLDLVSAATEITPADGSLIVGTRNFAFNETNLPDYPGGQLGQFARITVRDSGPGLSDAEFLQILDPSASARPAIASAAGTIARLGGFTRVESAEGIGTAVHLYFARVADASEGAAPGAVPSPTAQVAE